MRIYTLKKTFCHLNTSNVSANMINSEESLSASMYSLKIRLRLKFHIAWDTCLRLRRERSIEPYVLKVFQTYTFAQLINSFLPIAKRSGLLTLQLLMIAIVNDANHEGFTKWVWYDRESVVIKLIEKISHRPYLKWGRRGHRKSSKPF